MTHRYITATLVLLVAVAIETVAQALSDRYNTGRPVVIVCDTAHPPFAFVDNNGKPAGIFIDVANAVTEQLDVPCEFVLKDQKEAHHTFEQGNADVILDTDSIADIHFVGRDRQLIEQMDDQYMRLKENGDIAVIKDRWMHPERIHADPTPTALYTGIGLMLLAGLFCASSLLMQLRAKRMDDTTKDLEAMLSQARQMDCFYAIEDTQAARDLEHKYEAMLCNPFLAVSFYDNNGKLIVQNEAMKKLGPNNFSKNRLPLYNVKGEVTNYFVTIGRPADTAI